MGHPSHRTARARGHLANSCASNGFRRLNALVGSCEPSCTGVGLYHGLFGAGTGVVLGQFDKYTNYLQAARSVGANALNVSPRLFTFFATRGQWWTLNSSFLQGSILRGQQFFMSSPVLGATGNYALELDYLISRGIGPQQWQMVPLPY